MVTFTLSAQTKAEKKQIKEENAVKEYAVTKDLINSGNFKFVADWARTQKGRRINLISNPNYLKIISSEADIYLPYYGVVHTPSAGLAYESGIVFKGTPKNYKVEINDKKLKIKITFEGKGKNDQFDFILNIYKNGSANLSVNSNIRNSMVYDGVISELEKSSKPE